MKKDEIETVYNSLENHGDDFWNDEIVCVKDDPLSSNKELFLDILNCLHKDGYDLKLTKLEN